MATTVDGTDITRNYFSVINNPDGSLGYVIDAGLPTQHSVFALPDPPLFNQPEASYDAILKVNANYFILKNGLISQGVEDSLNIANNSRSCMVDATYGYGGGQGLRVITVKGGCQGICLSGMIQEHGTSYWDGDVSIDDWIDQTYNPSGQIDLSGLSSMDGKKVKVVANLRTGHISYGPNCQLALIPTLWRTAYWWFKWAVRKVLGIKVGQSGPSWLS